MINKVFYYLLKSQLTKFLSGKRKELEGGKERRKKGKKESGENEREEGKKGRSKAGKDL